MTEEQIKTKAKEQFPNDEFKQQIVIDAINWATKELQEEIKKIQHLADVRCNQAVENYQKWHVTNREKIDLEIKVEELEAQIEKMKRCEICKHYLWNHCSYETNISEDCIQNKLKHFELKENQQNDRRRKTET